MAGQAVMKGIEKSWSLLTFARENGKMQVGTFKNEAGETFRSTIFTNDAGERKFVNFSSNMGELTPKEIAEQKGNLQVVKLNEGGYILCKQGENAWEEVIL